MVAFLGLVKWLLMILLVAGAHATPAISWEKDLTAESIFAVPGGVLTTGTTGHFFDASGTEKASFPAGNWVNGYLGDGWYDLTGAKKSDAPAYDFLHETGVVSLGSNHKIFENGQLQREWTSQTCSGAPFSGKGETGVADLAYDNSNLALNGKWSVAPGNIFAAGLQWGGATVVFNNGTISHYAENTLCDGEPLWTIVQNAKPLAAWFLDQTYVHYNGTLFGGALKSFNMAGQALWEKPTPIVRDIIAVEGATVIAQNQLVWINKATGATEGRLPISATGLAQQDGRIFAVGAKLWAIENPLEATTTATSATSEQGSEVTVIPPTSIATVIACLAFFARQRK